MPEQRTNVVMVKMTHVLKDAFMAKMTTRKDQELDPTNNDHKPLIKYRQQYTKSVAAISQRKETMI